MSDPALAFSSYHLKPDPAIHEAGWGGRLIFREVRDYGRGVVYDRQDTFGDQELLKEALFPVVDRFQKFMKYALNHWMLDGDSRDRVVWRERNIIIVASPQGSCGYLYVTALIEYLSCTGKTVLEDVENVKTIDCMEWAESRFAYLDEATDSYRLNKWTGIRDLKAQRKELEAVAPAYG